mgnify:CR=1 FL=1
MVESSEDARLPGMGPFLRVLLESAVASLGGLRLTPRVAPALAASVTSENMAFLTQALELGVASGIIASKQQDALLQAVTGCENDAGERNGCRPAAAWLHAADPSLRLILCS